MNIAIQAPAAHPSFEWVRSEPIASLNLVVEEYRHRKTGAAHFHLAADYDENVFLVALRTVPEDSTGVAHILEHTALCGSERFPVRDPFFMMTRRSLNTFMNAFTSSDWTAYPFASRNRKDFSNLLEVYLDAVFFSRLDPLDFAQEGHRLEFSNPDDPNSPLGYKGVVYNEMKGAMSAITSTLWQTLSGYLFPSTTYHYNSGGDPEFIPDLGYQQLVDFYRSHYHPSNAIFMTFGDIPAAEHQAEFDDRALSRFEAMDHLIAVPGEKRFSAARRIEEYYALDPSEDASAKTHVVIGWLLGHSTDLEALLEAHLLSSVLLDNSSSVLRRALETSELGSAPSPLCGLEDSNREMVFVCGLEGGEAEHADSIEALILDTISEVAEQGVPHEQVAAVLHQLELQQREIGGDGYPYGLQLILTALGSVTHRGDPVPLLDLDPVLVKLQQRILDEDYIRGLARTLLVDNQHRVRLVMRPDQQLDARRHANETARLDAIRAELDEPAKQRIRDTAAALIARQNEVDDPDSLPRVTLEDVPEGITEIPSTELADFGCATTVFERGTNGIVYQQLVVELPQLPEEMLELLPFYGAVLTEVGIGELDYLATQALQASVSGGLSAYSSIRGSIDSEQLTLANFTLSSKALTRNASAMSELLKRTFVSPRFDEMDRLRELVQQIRARRDQSITGSGHSLAMSAACSGMSPAALLSERLTGLQGIRFARRLDESLAERSALSKFAERLQALHELFLKAPRQLLLITDAEHRELALQAVQNNWDGLAPVNTASRFSVEPVRERRVQIWQTSTQVNFCAMAVPTVAVEHPDAAALTVLGPFLRNGFLHRAIREQGGAYGAGASQDSGSANFRFFSYRDPRHSETLGDFRAAVDWLQSTQHDERQLEEAILGIISSFDKPSSPAGEAKQQFHNSLFGRTPAQRQRLRQSVLAVSMDDVRRVGARYLDMATASIAIVTNQDGAAALADDRALKGHQLLALNS